MIQKWLKFCYENGMYSQTAKDKYNQNNSIKFESEGIKSLFCSNSDAFTLVTGDMKVNAKQQFTWLI